MPPRTFSHKPQPSTPSAAPRFAVPVPSFAPQRIQASPPPAPAPRTDERFELPPVWPGGRPGETYLPTSLKAGVEALSGCSLDEVRVHYNSPKPAQFNALAHAKGTEIHLAPGQEEHLPHEAWHVVQQMQGRVTPGARSRDGARINTDEALESEADRMGRLALQKRGDAGSAASRGTEAAPALSSRPQLPVLQLKVFKNPGGSYSSDLDPSQEFKTMEDALAFEREREKSASSSGATSSGVSVFASASSDVAASAGDQPSAHRRPDIGTINAFFERNTTPRPPIGQQGMDIGLFKQNEAAYYQEFKERILRLRGNVDESRIVHLWQLMVECFQKKDATLAEKFLQVAEEEIGLKPLRAEGARIFWSGKASREHAYAISSPAGPTALEKTDIGQLLDKLSFFKVVPWDLSTILWALVSRSFGMGATGDMHVYLDGGFAKGNVFWNDELPMLRLMQRYGTVQNIIMHIWHTRDKRWLPEFDIDSGDLRLVFDKAKRIPAPTPENPQATRSFRYDKPIRVSALRGAFERFLQSPKRRHPLVLYEFRKKTGVYAKSQKESYGLRITLYEYGGDATKTIKVLADPPEEAFGKLPEIEAHLIQKYQGFAELPGELTF